MSMIIDYNGEQGINWFGRTYEYILGHKCKSSFGEAFKWWLEFDIYYNFILGKTYHYDKDNKLTIVKYDFFRIKKYLRYLIYKIKKPI